MYRAIFSVAWAVSLLFQSTHASSVLAGHRQRDHDHELLQALSARQIVVPPQCDSECLVISMLAGCAPQECCTDMVVRNLTQCFECVGNASGTTNYSSPQSTIDALFLDCAEEGLNITDPTLPGQNPNRTLSALPSTISSDSSSLHQSTVTALSLPFSQITITALSTSSTASSTSPASTSAVSGSISSNSALFGWNWLTVIGSVCTGAIFMA
ncbi:hypothetical protein BDP27DRAFT_1313754 [Rhodocollybia butyracea]|uniref:Uncharacterized protein n=1 Tax=Rhodocollybia butyracea TaxID=206335 RepID=A0A9P5UDZ2_9AGAR|nr:hypothetical protein BDP27DRAFT_1313754 [Rhodocollybia butyracea]